jgi:hypothetical protein
MKGLSQEFLFNDAEGIYVILLLLFFLDMLLRVDNKQKPFLLWQIIITSCKRDLMVVMVVAAEEDVEILESVVVLV